MMRILVTGGLGFIGSNFILHILKNQPSFSIVNVDAEFLGSNQNNLIEIQNMTNYKFIHGNITDFKLMDKLISECDAVVNFAAESFVDRSIFNAEPFFNSNVRGVFILLEIIKKQQKKFLHISTDEVYGSLQSGSAVEDTRFNPSSPYAATKAAAELLINSYMVTYGCDCNITRCTNNYGPRQFVEKLIPKTIILAARNQKIPVYGNGKNIRDWLYVDDHCDAIAKVLLDGKSRESYNISANNEVDNISIVTKILQIMNKSTDLIKFVDDRPGHDFRYSMNSSKIRTELKWLPKTTFETGLTKTIEWYLKHREWWENISSNMMNPTPWKN